MARPTQHRTITKRFRVSAEEEARLVADAAQTGKNESDYCRHRLFSDKPLVTGKGMSRPELRECLELATAVQGRLKGMDADADLDMQRLNELIYKALRNDS